MAKQRPVPPFVHTGAIPQCLPTAGGLASDMVESFRFADITVRITREHPFRVSEAMRRFAVNAASAELTIVMDREDPTMQGAPLPFAGEDLFRRYYTDGSAVRIEMKGSKGSSTAVFTCRAGREALHYCVRFRAGDPVSITSWLSLLPMAWLLFPYGALFLHSSRVAWNGGAILFSGASGVGKTTQARLWQTYGGGRIVGNDRTILRRTEDSWQTYGYFEDGDAPIASPERLPLRAIVFLSQAEENRVCRRPPARAAQLLMGQTVLAQWDGEMRKRALNEWLTLVQEIPVYHLQCRADADAVLCLRRQLEADGAG